MTHTLITKDSKFRHHTFHQYYFPFLSLCVDVLIYIIIFTAIYILSYWVTCFSKTGHQTPLINNIAPPSSSSSSLFLVVAETSMNSMSKAPSSSDVNVEESGWTQYFEDFCNGDRSSMSSGVGAFSSSLLSDAASLVATTNKLADGHHEFSGNKNGKRLSFKKRKKDIVTMVDDALEDTASSPLNSPKVLHENRSEYKPKQMEDTRLSEEKRSISGEREERKEMGFMERESDCTELKKRGLCLVPLSVVVNYFG